MVGVVAVATIARGRKPWDDVLAGRANKAAKAGRIQEVVGSAGVSS